MTKKGEAILNGILIFVIGSLLVVGIINIISNPDPTRMIPINNNEEVCRPSLTFDYQNEGKFYLSLRNDGYGGSMFVRLLSQDASSRSKNGDDFANVSEESRKVPAGSTREYDFDIKRKDNDAENITLSIEYGVGGILGSIQKPYNFCCEYTRERRNSNTYLFVKETEFCE